MVMSCYEPALSSRQVEDVSAGQLGIFVLSYWPLHLAWLLCCQRRTPRICVYLSHPRLWGFLWPMTGIIWVLVLVPSRERVGRGGGQSLRKLWSAVTLHYIKRSADRSTTNCFGCPSIVELLQIWSRKWMFRCPQSRFRKQWSFILTLIKRNAHYFQSSKTLKYKSCTLQMSNTKISYISYYYLW